MNKLKCLGIVLATFDCTSLTDTTRPRHLANLGAGEDVYISLPATIARGTRFNVNIRSTACPGYEEAPSDVKLDGMTATVKPYIRSVDHRVRDCTIIWHTVIHTAWLRFNEPGQATVTVVGRGAGGDTLRISREVTIR